MDLLSKPLTHILKFKELLRKHYMFMYQLPGVMIICSKFDCSKNLLDTILLLLDTVRAIIFFLVNCSKIKNHEKSSAVRYFEQFHFLSKKMNCSKIKWSTKVVENVNCSTQFIVKKMVYMYGS